MVTRSGITWDHPRGRAPLIVTAEEFARDHGVPIKRHEGRRGASCKAQHELAQERPVRRSGHRTARSLPRDPPGDQLRSRRWKEPLPL